MSTEGKMVRGLDANRVDDLLRHAAEVVIELAPDGLILLVSDVVEKTKRSRARERNDPAGGRLRSRPKARSANPRKGWVQRPRGPHWSTRPLAAKRVQIAKSPSNPDAESARSPWNKTIKYGHLQDLPSFSFHSGILNSG